MTEIKTSREVGLILRRAVIAPRVSDKAKHDEADREITVK